MIRGREDRLCPGREVLDVFRDRKGVRRETQGLRVEGPGEQRPLPEEKEVARGGVGNVAVGVEDELPLAAVQRGRVDAVLLAGPQAVLGEIQEPPAVGQKDGPAVTDLRRTGVELRHRRGLAAGGRNAMDDLAGVRNEQDHSLAVPASSSAERRVRECLWGSARSVDLLQLPVGEEPDEPAVRGPEGIRSSLRPGER